MPTGPLHAVLRHLAETDRTDAQLLADHVDHRDDSALAALVRRHAAMVWGVCRRLLPREADAEDAFQATFLVFVRRAASIASPEGLAGWLHGVAYQTARKARAMAGRRAARERQVAALPETAVTEPDRGDAAALDAALTALPEIYRVAVVLCDLEGMTRTEAARLLGVPEGTLAARVARGRRLLARRVGDGTPPAALPVPMALVTATIETATTGAASAAVAALTEGVLNAMLLVRLKFALSAVLWVGVLVGLATLAASAGVAPVPDPAAGWKEALVLKHDHPVTTLACSADRIAAGDAGGNLVLYDAVTGKNRRVKLVGGMDFKTGYDGLRFTADGKLLFAIREERGGIWMTRPGDDDQKAWGLGGGGTRFLELSADGKVWLEANGQSLVVRPNPYYPDNPDVAVPGYESAIRYPAEPVHAAMSPPEGKYLAIFTADGTLHLHERAARKETDLLEATTKVELGKQVVTALQFSADGKRLVVVGEDGFARVYDPANGKELVAFEGHRGVVFCACFSPDGKTVVTGGDDNVARVWDAATGKLLAVLAGHTDSVRVVAFDLPGERLLTGSADRTLRAWRLAP